ncbi:hypothetical protein DERF_000044 [Dermatophagoides farinae]|uniref:Sialin n=1 Tax=Dermatophagoides farinae TaxID=6954 RepID=A0A922I837_DERFA|nr:hypothetical protein DERF_000044 [Dermatophagoides farinae]
MNPSMQNVIADSEPNPNRKMTKCQCLPKRFILVIMGFFGYNLLYMLRVNLSVAIVSMVDHNHNQSNQTWMIMNNNGSNNMTITNGIIEKDKFDWNENIQALILSSFFAGYVITQFPGGRLADLFGSKWLFGLGIMATSILTIISPFAARIHYSVFIGCRVLEGLFEGLAYPSMHSMFAKWIPLYERSRMSTFMYSGSQIGTVLTMPIAALLCDSEFFGGWPSVFYVFGSIGLIWCAIWFIVVHETPEIHPTIQRKELEMIIANRNNDLTKKKPKMPWRSIITSVPLWALVIAHFGQNWGFYTFLTQLPRYFQNVLHFDIKKNGLYSSLPYLCQAIVGCMAGYICDKLYASQFFRLGTLRKTANTIAFLGPTICLLLLIQIGNNDPKWSIILFTIALGCNGMFLAGYHVTHLDMSPTYASTLMGITNCLANLAGIFAPYVVGIILTNVQIEKQKQQQQQSSLSSNDGWNQVFYVSCIIYILSALIFVLFGSNERQTWDNCIPDDDDDDDDI